MSNKEPLAIVENDKLNEDELWYKTIQEDTLTSYKYYVTKFPAGKKAQKAHFLIKHYELIRTKQEKENLENKSTSENPAVSSLSKNVLVKESAAPSTLYVGKRKFYPALFSLLSILILIAGFITLSRMGTVNTIKFEGVDSIIVPVTKSNSFTEIESGSLPETLVEERIKIDGPLPGSNPALPNNQQGNKIEEKVVTVTPVEIDKSIGSIHDSSLITKLTTTAVEPIIVKDSISPREEWKGPLKIPHGLQLSVILDEPLSSEEVSKHGTQIKLHCSESVDYGGQTIIARGAPVVGRIVDVVPSTGRKKALIGFVIESIKAIDGSVLFLDSPRYRKPASEHGKPVGYSDGLVFYARLKKH